MLYGIKGQKPTKTEIREYQSSKLGRNRGVSYLVELLPLPSPNTKVFYFDKFSNLRWLRSRKAYVEHVKERRIAHLTKKIQEHRPIAVVFYGKSNWKDYRKIAGVEFRSTKIDGVKIGNNERTLFILAKAPVAFGATNKDFYQIGRMTDEGVAGVGRW